MKRVLELWQADLVALTCEWQIIYQCFEKEFAYKPICEDIDVSYNCNNTKTHNIID